jgi:glycogen debranching enzyme
VGQLPEIFDGDAPQRPRGCIAQAWTVAELLRVLVEDVYPARTNDRPPRQTL